MNSGTIMTTGGTTISAMMKLRIILLPRNGIRENAYAAKQAKIVVIKVDPNVTMTELRNHRANFPPRNAE
jgi:hypothetical protein